MKSYFKLVKIGLILFFIGIRIDLLRQKLNKECLKQPLTSEYLNNLSNKMNSLGDKFFLNEEKYIICELDIIVRNFSKNG